MGVLSLRKRLLSRKKRKKRVIKLPETYHKDYALCEAAYKALTIMAEIEKKPKKRILDLMVIWFFKGYYIENALKKTTRFAKRNPNIQPGEIQYYKKNHITKEANDYLTYIAQNEGLSRKKCLDNIILWLYSYYMGTALNENNYRRWINDSLPKKYRKILPSRAVGYLRKKAVEARIGSYPTIVRKGL